MVDNLIIRNGNQDTLNEGGTKTKNEDVVSVDTNHSVPVNGCEVNMRTVERNFSDRVRCETDNVIATVDTKVDNTILVAMD